MPDASSGTGHDFSVLADVRPYLHDRDAKREYNQKLFSIVAARYRESSRILSFGQDHRWKELLIRKIPDLPAASILDIASGTGDIAILLSRRFPDASIFSADLSRHMLIKAGKELRRSVSIIQSLQDMCALPFKSSSLDLITGGYALRNAPSLEILLDEIVRVLKPGGYGAFLDFSRFDSIFAGSIEYAILKMWGDVWGTVLHGNHSVYGYIAESLLAFPSRKVLHGMIMSRGFKIEYSHRLFFGILEIIVFRSE